MNQPISFNIYVLSYKRPKVNLTERLLEYCTYVVRESEAEEYRENGHVNLKVIPKDCPCYNFMDTFYWTIWNTPEDVICIIDDDIQQFAYRMDQYSPIKIDKKGIETATSEIERIAQLIVDLNIGLAFDSVNGMLLNYDAEFKFKGMPGHIRWVNKSAFKAKYNHKDPCSSDVDVVMQEVMLNRIALQEKYFWLRSPMEKALGENETIEYNKRRNLHHALKNKWGKYYHYDQRKNQARMNIPGR